ncbi:MAG: oxidase EvaA, partial [Bacteroidia bacterium]
MIENINTRFGEKPTIYTEAFSEYKKMFGALYDPSVPSHCMEMHFESCRDWSLFSTVSEVAKWYTSIVENHDMKVEVIPLGQCKGWSLDASTGNLNHASKDFFSIQGVRVETSSREVSSGWDQPILTQIGLDGGILGLMRKRFTGVPHYLCEAKMEPGNYNIVQISPTLQATFANINSVHGGRKPLFLKYFIGS